MKMNILIEHNHDVIHYIVDMILDQYYKIAQLNKFFHHLIVKDKHKQWMTYRIQYYKIRTVLYNHLNIRKEYELIVVNIPDLELYDIIPILVNNLKYVKNIKNYGGSLKLRIYPNEFLIALDLIYKFYNKPFNMMDVIISNYGIPYIDFSK